MLLRRGEESGGEPLLDDCAVGFDDVGHQCPPAVCPSRPLDDEARVWSAGRLRAGDPAVPARRGRQRDGVPMPSSRTASHPASIAHSSNACSGVRPHCRPMWTAHVGAGARTGENGRRLGKHTWRPAVCLSSRSHDQVRPRAADSSMTRQLPHVPALSRWPNRPAKSRHVRPGNSHKESLHTSGTR